MWLTLASTALLLFQNVPAATCFSLLPTSKPYPQHRLPRQRHLPSLRCSAAEPQVVRFVEPTTNVPVVLVGTMHYNPVSIQRTKAQIDSFGQEGRLGAVVIESCGARWEKTKKQDELMNRWLPNEMSAAVDSAWAYNKPVVLGDQLIFTTLSKAKKACEETIGQLSSVEGIIKIGSSIRDSWTGMADGGIGASDLLEPLLLLGTPVAIARYTAALTLKSPTLLGVFCGLLLFPVAMDVAVESTSGVDIGWLIQTLELVGTALIELVLVRVFLVVLLAERNQVLASNILLACHHTKEAEGGAVVAVIGMAHCNGVQSLLETRMDMPPTDQEYYKNITRLAAN